MGFVCFTEAEETKKHRTHTRTVLQVELLLFGVATCCCGSLDILADLEPLHEAIDLSCSVQNTLFASVKWVTFGTDVETKVLFGGNAWPLCAAAGACVHRCICFWMDSLLHHVLLTVQPRLHRR